MGKIHSLFGTSMKQRPPSEDVVCKLCMHVSIVLEHVNLLFKIFCISYLNRVFKSEIVILLGCGKLSFAIKYSLK